MDKQEFEQLSGIFDEIAFIEKLEQMAKNSGNGSLLFTATSVIPRIHIGCGWQQSHNDFITIPENLSVLILANLVSYKDVMKDIVSNLAVVDKSAVPDPPEDDADTDTPESEDNSED